MGASFGVVIPTRFSATLLPDHLAAAQSWLDLADQVVAVDSFSTDGTQEILREQIKHPRFELLSHPPGLYASWNAGIRALTTDYTYISTIGDTISREGIGLLLQTAIDARADVVLSKPVFRKTSGEIVQKEWPIDDIVRCLGISTPRPLTRLEAIIFANVHATRALTGSCASDLFRTEALQRYPFSTSYGTEADGIWGVQHAADLSWTVLKEKFSTFLLHSTSRSGAENRVTPGAPRADTVLRAAVDAWRKEGLLSEAELSRIGWDALTSAVTEYLDAKSTFDRYRKAPWPWILHPLAWKARGARGRALRRVAMLKEQALRAAAQA